MPQIRAQNPLEFDDPFRDGAVADGSAPQKIANTLRDAGIDAPSSLYNESLVLARDGHLGQAVSRLQMLLCLDPEDSDALLLLARVHAAQGRHQEALARLDAAVAAGVVAPHGFRDHLENLIQSERRNEEEHRNRVLAREQGEIRGLRAETRQLRTDNIRLEADVQDVLRRERTWKIATLAIALFSTGVVLALMILPPAGTPTGASENLAAGTTGSGGSLATATQGAGQVGAVVVGEAAPGLTPVVVGESTPGTVATPAGEASKTAPEAIKPEDKKPESKKTEAKKTEIKPSEARQTTPAPSASSEASEPPTAGGRIHVVAAGETLGKISQKYYGRSSDWPKIQAANADILKNGVALRVGMKLKIP